jgi:hypothetical protein
MARSDCDKQPHGGELAAAAENDQRARDHTRVVDIGQRLLGLAFTHEPSGSNHKWQCSSVRGCEPSRRAIKGPHSSRCGALRLGQGSAAQEAVGQERGHGQVNQNIDGAFSYCTPLEVAPFCTSVSRASSVALGAWRRVHRRPQKKRASSLPPLRGFRPQPAQLRSPGLGRSRKRLARRRSATRNRR